MTRTPRLVRRTAALALAGATALFAGCATQSVYVDAEDTPPACDAFIWQPPATGPSPAHNQIQAAVQAALEARGYPVAQTGSGAQADCGLTYAVRQTAEGRSSSPRIGIGVGSYGGGVGGSVGTSVPVGDSGGKGDLTVTVIDLSRNAEIWRGTLSNAVDVNRPDRADIENAAEKIIAEFPDRTGS